LQRVVVVELSRLEAPYAAARVGEWEHDTALEVVVPPAVAQPDCAQLVLRVALLHGARREPRRARRIAEPELAADLFLEPPRRGAAPRARRRRGLPQRPRVELGRPLKERPQSLLALPLPLLLGRRLLVLELDAEPPRQELDRVDELDVLDLHDERDRVAALAATKALERAAGGRDGEARRPLLMEGTEALVPAA